MAAPMPRGDIRSKAQPTSAHAMAAQDSKPAREFFIQGLTSKGKPFRPSDWAERLAGVMSCFRPEGSGGPQSHLQYSPLVRPTMLGGVKSIVVSEALRELEPLAYHFILDFARDNDLQVIDACPLPEPPSPGRP